MRIDKRNFTETKVHEFTTFASDIGIKVGEQLPHSVEVPGLGNGLAFHLLKASGEKAVYRQELGCVELTIYND